MDFKDFFYKYLGLFGLFWTLLARFNETKCPIVFSVISSLTMQCCVIDGLDQCARFISLDKNSTNLHIMHCVVSNMHSFITVIEPDWEILTRVEIMGCSFIAMQDGIKIIVRHDSNVHVSLAQVEMELIILDEDLPSHGVSMTAGSLDMRNSSIEATHPDFVGLSLHSLKIANIALVSVECSEDMIPKVYTNRYYMMFT